jgi:hypothetical protein
MWNNPNRQNVLLSYQRSSQCVGTLLVMLSLGACGGLPKVGERPASTAMKNNGGTALAAAVRPRVAGGQLHIEATLCHDASHERRTGRDRDQEQTDQRPSIQSQQTCKRKRDNWWNDECRCH